MGRLNFFTKLSKIKVACEYPSNKMRALLTLPLEMNFTTAVGNTINLFTFSAEHKYEDEHLSVFRLSTKEPGNGTLASFCECKHEQLDEVFELVSAHVTTGSVTLFLNSKYNNRLSASIRTDMRI